MFPVSIKKCAYSDGYGFKSHAGNCPHGQIQTGFGKALILREDATLECRGRSKCLGSLSHKAHRENTDWKQRANLGDMGSSPIQGIILKERRDNVLHSMNMKEACKVTGLSRRTITTLMKSGRWDIGEINRRPDGKRDTVIIWSHKLAAVTGVPEENIIKELIKIRLDK